MKLTAITSIGRGTLQPNEIFEGTPPEIYNKLNSCFINGCELEGTGKDNIWKVYAGYGSHVGDIRLEGTNEEKKEFFRQ